MADPSRDRDPDVLVIGGGAGGLSAARAAARRGASVALVEQGRLGGDCTFIGCIPSKALIEAAARGASFSEAMAGVHCAVESIAATEDDDAVGRQGVVVVHGRARFTAPGRVDVDGSTWRPRTIIIAAGGRPAVPTIPGLEGVSALTNETVFDLDRQPARLAVLGGGAIGCELAQAFQRLGTTVIVIEAASRLLATEERDASEVLTSVLRRHGVDVRLATRVTRVEPAAEGALRLLVDSGDTLEVDALLLAVGRRASASGGWPRRCIPIRRGRSRCARPPRSSSWTSTVAELDEPGAAPHAGEPGPSWTSFARRSPKARNRSTTSGSTGVPRRATASLIAQYVSAPSPQRRHISRCWLTRRATRSSISPSR